MKRGAVIACQHCIAGMYNSGHQGQWELTTDGLECEVHNPQKTVPEQSQEGTKHDSGKPQLSLLTRESLEAEARAFEYGAKKYDKNNYKKGMNWSRVIDAALRHLTAFNAKEDFDKESSLNHLWHAKACLAMLIYYYEHKVGNDDR